MLRVMFYMVRILSPADSIVGMSSRFFFGSPLLLEPRIQEFLEGRAVLSRQVRDVFRVHEEEHFRVRMPELPGDPLGIFT